MDLEDLKDQMKFALHSAKKIMDKVKEEGRAASAEELREVDDLRTDAKKAESQIEELQETEKRQKSIQEDMDRLSKPETRRSPAPEIANATAGGNIEVQSMSRYAKLRSFKGKNAEINAYKSGQWLMAVLTGDSKAKRWCRDNGVDIESRAMGESSNVNGGVLVPSELGLPIIDLREEYGVARQECRIQPMSRDAITVPVRTGGLTAYFTSESGSITESQSAWGNIGMVAKKLATYTRISSELSEDSIINLADDVAMDVAIALSEKEDNCLVNGDGTSTYDGIVGLIKLFTDGVGTLVGSVNAASGHDLVSEIDQTDLATVMGKLPAYARNGAKWYCSQTFEDVIFSRLAVAAGGNTIQTVGGAVTHSYLGYPIVTSEAMPTSTGTINNAPMLFFGNMRLAAILGDRRQVTIGTSEHAHFQEDQIAIKATERFDINVHGIGTSSVAGPIVALIGKTS